MAAVGGAAANAVIRRVGNNGANTTALKTIYFAAKRTTDRNDESSPMQIASSGEAQLHVFCTTGNGDSMRGYGNWGSTNTVLGVIDNTWWHYAAVGHSTDQLTWYHSPDGENWASYTGTVTQTPFSINELKFFDSGRSENFNGKIARVRVWDAALNTAELTLEAFSAQAVRTSNLVSDHRLVGTVLSTVLAGETGSAFTAPNGGITVDLDEPPIAAEESVTDNASATDGVDNTLTFSGVPVFAPDHSIAPFGTALINETVPPGGGLSVDTTQKFLGKDSTKINIPVNLPGAVVEVGASTANFDLDAEAEQALARTKVIAVKTDGANTITGALLSVGNGSLTVGYQFNRRNHYTDTHDGWTIFVREPGADVVGGSPDLSGNVRTRLMLTASANIVAGDIWVGFAGVLESQPPTVVLTFDDGYTEWTWLASELASRGLPASFGISYGDIGKAGYLTSSAVQAIGNHASGLFEITNHAEGSDSLGDLGLSGYIDAVEDCRTYIEGLGLDPYAAKLHTWVQGQLSLAAIDELKDLGYHSARAVETPGMVANHVGIALDGADSGALYAIPATVYLSDAHTVADVQAQMELAKHGGTIFVVGHEFKGSAGGNGWINGYDDDYGILDLLDWLVERRNAGWQILRWSDWQLQIIGAGPTENATDNASATESSSAHLSASSSVADDVAATDVAQTALSATASATDDGTATDVASAGVSASVGVTDDGTATDSASGDMPGSESVSDPLTATDAATYQYTPHPPDPPDPTGTPFLGPGHRILVRARIDGVDYMGTYDEIRRTVEEYARVTSHDEEIARRTNRERRARVRRQVAALREALDVVDVNVDGKWLALDAARDMVYRGLRDEFSSAYNAQLARINQINELLVAREAQMRAARLAAQQAWEAELAADDAEAIQRAEEFFKDDLT